MLSNNNIKDETYLDLLIQIGKGANSQRQLSNELGFSLGKLNYCINALKNKGLIKIKNFKNSKNRLNYIYILTPKGIAKKTKLALKFMKKKMIESDQLKKEIEQKNINA